MPTVTPGLRASLNVDEMAVSYALGQWSPTGGPGTTGGTWDPKGWQPLRLDHMLHASPFNALSPIVDITVLQIGALVFREARHLSDATQPLYKDFPVSWEPPLTRMKLLLWGTIGGNVANKSKSNLKREDTRKGLIGFQKSKICTVLLNKSRGMHNVNISPCLKWQQCWLY